MHQVKSVSGVAVDRILDLELSAIATIAHPEGPNRFLARIEDFCELRSMRSTPDNSACAASGFFRSQAIAVAQAVAQASSSDSHTVSTACKYAIAGVAKWQTHRT